MSRALFIIYTAGSVLTFLFLTFGTGYPYNAWNWLIAIPVNLFLSTIWPIYWPFLHWMS